MTDFSAVQRCFDAFFANAAPLAAFHAGLRYNEKPIAHLTFCDSKHCDPPLSLQGRLTNHRLVRLYPASPSHHELGSAVTDEMGSFAEMARLYVEARREAGVNDIFVALCPASLRVTHAYSVPEGMGRTACDTAWRILRIGPGAPYNPEEVPERIVPILARVAGMLPEGGAFPVAAGPGLLETMSAHERLALAAGRDALLPHECQILDDSLRIRESSFLEQSLVSVERRDGFAQLVVREPYKGTKRLLAIANPETAS